MSATNFVNRRIVYLCPCQGPVILHNCFEQLLRHISYVGRYILSVKHKIREFLGRRSRYIRSERSSNRFDNPPVLGVYTCPFKRVL